ncbi:hypothetical protein Y032_0242g3419 [Ancylostoma ceylanicum]|uniref:Uncharacterized protein n=1 Tax=Ancylostoma ceylanicum TaxID=53326 RepID=A0A016SDH1_9BILA|nr:hypothetical protein Y032_0242g3419 [Ancylostoma ceylanicum]
MLYFYLLPFAVLPLYAAILRGAEKPPGDCGTNQSIFPEKDKYVKKINEYRKIMIEGQQKNGKSGRNLPTGENVAEMLEDHLSSTKMSKLEKRRLKDHYLTG